MSQLLERFHAERNAFERIRKQSESKVARWAYWDRPDWFWDPEYVVKYWSSRPPQRTQKEKARYAYGYDDKKRVTVIHSFSFGDPRKLNSMEFLRYSGDRIVGSHFIAEAIYSGNMVVGNDWEAGGVLADLFEATLSGGRVVKVEQLYGTGWDWKTISWDGDNVASVVEGVRGRKAHRQITYGKAGKMLEDLDLSKPIKRKPLPNGVTMNSLANEIRQRLVKAVVTTVTKAKIKETVYCLALNYDCEGNPLLLPELGIGLDSERQAQLKRGGCDAKLSIWEPEEFSLFAKERTALQGRDKELDRACQLFNRELEYKGSDEPARKLILQAAADLAKVDWKGKLITTDDFIVYAVDTDGADLRKNLKVSVSSKQLAKLKAAKLL